MAMRSNMHVHVIWNMASLIYEQILFTQLTDQPLALFEHGHFTKVPLIMVGDNLIATTHCLNNRLISGYKHCWRDPVRLWNYGLWSSGKICVPLHNFTISRFLLRGGREYLFDLHGVTTGRAPNRPIGCCMCASHGQFCNRLETYAMVGSLYFITPIYQGLRGGSQLFASQPLIQITISICQWGSKQRPLTNYYRISGFPAFPCSLVFTCYCNNMIL